MTEQKEYDASGYIALPRLFAPVILEQFYADMSADLTRSGQSIGRFSTRGPLLSKDAIEIYAHHYTPMLSFLWGLTPRVSQVAGCELLPTYAYFRLYQKGDICRVHSDRPACEHSLSLTLLCSDKVPWSLSVSTESDASPRPIVEDDFASQPYGTVSMLSGDAVMYKGVHHRHGRLDANPNAWSAHLFMHWVDAAGPYRDQAFDRPTIEQARLQTRRAG
jgi:hypothetical protein